jgi:hypothetical protein
MSLLIISIFAGKTSPVLIYAFIFKFDLDITVAGRYDNWLVNLDYFLSWGWLCRLGVVEVVGNVNIYILIGIEHVAYYYAGCYNSKHLS